MPVLTAIDVIGIQSYVFASNRLRDVVGASLLVEWATKAGGGLNVEGAPSPEIVMAAGGNAILSFKDEDQAKAFVLRYTRRLLDAAPGLDVAVAHREYQHGQLAQGLLALQVKLAAAKLSRRPHAPQLGLGIMKPCAITGLPACEASKHVGEEQWVSRRIAMIRQKTAQAAADDHWESDLDDFAKGSRHLEGRILRFPQELDKMGRTRDDTSLIGVVHIDGDGIGRRIQNWLVDQQGKQLADDQAVKDDIRKWSNALDGLVRDVFRGVLKRLIDRIRPKERETGVFQVQGQPSPPRQLDFDLLNEDDAILLPLRPILLGGDDLTFVCDGRVALDLTATALTAFGEKSKHCPELEILGGGPITACAGVALVRAHAPFSRSYELCEALCASAKQEKRDAEAHLADDTGCWLDWHVGAVRPDEPLDVIRRRQYSGRELTCRPYLLDGDTATRLTWRWLDTELLGEPNGDDHAHSFRNPRVWGERRNKVKALASLVRDGEKAIESQLDAWRRVEKTIALPKPIENGFHGGRTPLLDAVELLDRHLRLEPPRTATNKEGEPTPQKAKAAR